MKCPTCGGDTIQKSRLRLFIVGLAFLISPGLAILSAVFWVPAIILALIGLYLVLWATLGRGRWCRNCKKFSIG